LCPASEAVTFQKVLGSFAGFSSLSRDRVFAIGLSAIGLIAFARPASGQG